MTELVFILDRSGSMSGLESDTIGGFNSMIEKQKKEKVEVKDEVNVESEVNGNESCAIGQEMPVYLM